MNVQELMLSPLMKSAQLLAGIDGLSRDIFGCVPDISIIRNKSEIPGLLLLCSGADVCDKKKHIHDLLNYSPAGIILYDKQKAFSDQTSSLARFDSSKTALISMPTSYNPYTFAKRLSSLIYSQFSKEDRMKDFLREICYSSAPSPDETLAESFGYRSGYSYCCVYGSMEINSREHPLSTEMDLEISKNLFDSFLSAKPENTTPLSFIEENHLIAFVPCPDRSRTSFRHILLETTALVRRQLPNRNWRFAAGAPADSLWEFQDSFHTARKTLHITRELNISEPLSFHDDWYMHTLLLQAPKNILRKNMEHTLAPLLQYPELLDTLGCYLSYGENRKLTADHLHIHVNSLKYRLQKIARLLDRSLDDPKVRFQLRLSFIIYQYLS